MEPLNINEEQVCFYELIGRTITQWAHIEQALFSLAYNAFGPETRTSLGDAFASIENFRSKLAFTDRAVTGAKHLDEYASDWAALRDEVQAASKLRNSLAHSRVVIFGNAPPGRRLAIIPNYSAPLDKRHNPNNPPPGSLCVRDIDLIRLRFAKAWRGLMSIYFRAADQSDPFEGSPPLELKPQTLAQLKRQIRAVSSPRA